MKKLQNKTKIATTIIILTLTLSVIMAAMPTASAQDYSHLMVDPYVYVNAIPNPQQINQIVLIHVGSVWPTPNVNTGWDGLTVTVTRPDGTEFMLGPFDTDSTGGTGGTFTPTQVGTYKLQSYFPEQKNFDVGSGFFQAMAPRNCTMIEDYSQIIELEVIEGQIQHFPIQPMPTEYWTRPIDAQLWNWQTISGNWLGDQVSMDSSPPAQTLYAEYNDDAPNTGHILWAKPLTMGGLAGGQMGAQGFMQSDAYEPQWTGSVIIGGILFYNEFETTGSETGLERNVIAVDLHTGEELWHKPLLDRDGNNRNLDWGQVFYWDSYNFHGVFPYLWTSGGGAWNAYDPYTGRWEYTMEGVPGGTRVYGPKGEIFVYSLSTFSNTLSLWNSSRVVADMGSWRPHGRVYDAEDTADGIEWTVNITDGLPGGLDKVRDGIILGTNCDKYNLSYDKIAFWAISTEPGMEGTLLYNRSWLTPVNVGHYDIQDASVEDDVFTLSRAEDSTHYGFRLSTGTLLWGPSESQHYTDNWGYSSSNSWDNIYDGKYFSGSYGGQVWCRDVQTGVTLWVYDVTDHYAENLHNNKWRFRPAFFADGKLYIENTEHNPFDPQHRQAPFVAINITTGEEVFRMPYRCSEWSSTMIIGDSIIATFNTYDERVYAIGKGPSAVSVEAPLTSVSLGDSLVLRGRVTDTSPGTQTDAIKMRFPNGVPAVADADQTAWMQYVYNQFGQPWASGVQVKLEVVMDPNGNYYDIGTATTDTSGFYSIAWEPEVPGQYMILASFAETESYYSSYVETAIVVDEAPESVTPTQVTVTEYPGYEGPTAAQVAQNVLDNLPDNPTSSEIAQAVENQLDLPEPTEPTETPEYSTMDIIIVVLVALGIVIGLVSLLRKRQ